MSDPLVYSATPTGAALHNSTALERWLIGPVGSGKTTAMIMDMFMRMLHQTPHPRTKKRQTRFVVIRESYPQLVSTTIKSFMEWVGQYGKLSGQSPIKWAWNAQLPDGTFIETEILFYAMSEGFDTSKLRSLEVTGVYLSEFAELAREIVDVAATRLRYPKTHTKLVDGYDHGPSWLGIVGESNAPPEASHWYERFEINRPANCAVFKYPPALIREFNEATDKYEYTDNPEAENIAHLPGGFAYYHNMIASMSDEAIDNLVLNNYGRDLSGRPVYPRFSRVKHVVDADTLLPNVNYPVIIGLDPGLNAAAILGQMGNLGSLNVLDEVVTEGLTFETFIDEHLIPMLKQRKYVNCKFQAVIDPAAIARNAMNELTSHEMLRKKGIPTKFAVTNKLQPRIKAVEHFLQRDGMLRVSSGCTVLIGGFEGGYRYQRVRGAAGRVYKPEPEKNRFSHPHDGLQYMCLEYIAETSLQGARDRERAMRQQPSGSRRFA
ncbi:MAG: hypothetical protein DI640_13185 [Sphingomonas taxi]|uniref:Terminase n=1 Tax=Sphingomonas taxi TaxID=1549858 RepID=A0A2W4YVP9_9SPHN|nr:MAG: hypothetical protein DI640_13185 [Sphingomonas taxi]